MLWPSKASHPRRLRDSARWLVILGALSWGPSADGLAREPAESARTILARPVAQGPQREALVQAYLHAHCPRQLASGSRITPRVVVIHWTGGRSLEGAWRYFNRLEAEPGRAELFRQGRLNVGTHFLVGTDGAVVQLLPEDVLARHAIGLNTSAIGIDMVGRRAQDLTDAQLDSVTWLVRQLATRHPIRQVVGHHETHLLEGSDAWCEDVPGYRSRKPDPGPDFMRRLRARLADLALDGGPGVRR